MRPGQFGAKDFDAIIVLVEGSTDQLPDANLA
jgi:hypothetical protein